MRRSVLLDKSFVTWANDHVIALVTHDGLEHEETEAKDSYGKDVKRCSLYPGISCSEHVGTSVDVDNARGDGLVKLPFVELCPNTWIVTPAGEVIRVEEADQFDAGKERKAIEAVLKKVGKPLPAEDYRRLEPLLARAEKATDDEHWKDALTDLAAIEKSVKPLPEGLRSVVQGLLDKIEVDALWAFEHARDDEKATPEVRRTRVEQIRAALDVPVLGQRVPSYEAIQAWLAAK